jgi:hypothetical protein
MSFVISVFLLLSTAYANSSTSRPTQAGDIHAQSPDAEVLRVVLKFHEGTHVRLRDGALLALEQGPEERAQLNELGLDSFVVEAELETLHRLIESEPLARNLARSFTADEDLLSQRKRSGEARTGRQLEDLNLYFEIELPPGTEYGDTEALVETLNGFMSIEVAYAETPGKPPHGDIPPTTPLLENGQGYLDPAPWGVDARYAWTKAGGAGQGVKIVDVEEFWNADHEDLPSLFHERDHCGSLDPSICDDAPIPKDHGTAVLGVLTGIRNGYGITGIAHGADVGYESIVRNLTPPPLGNWGYIRNVADSINQAAIHAGPGGVVLIEWQASTNLGTPTMTECGCSPTDCYLVPVEYNDLSYAAIAMATANQTIVVEAAANGSTSLDDPIYGGLFDRGQRDSGAILVAASLSSSRTPACFSNWGSRVDVHSWGENVVTLGKGDHPQFDENAASGDENQFYRDSFAGTSSASAIVAGVVASVQGAMLARGLDPLSPEAMRDLLVTTGTPQQQDLYKHIGPQPDLRAALDLDTTPPTVDSVTVSDHVWEIGSNHTVTVKATDFESGVRELRALINKQGSNSANRRGNFSWRDQSLGYLWTGDQVSCVGGGWASKRPDLFNPETVTLIGCSTSLSGSQRTVTFTIRPEATFGAFGPINDISAWARDFALNVPSPTWPTFDINFSSVYSNVSSAPALDFGSYTIEGYGGTGQAGHPTVTVEDGGATLHVVGNGWRKISFPYNVAPDTVIELDFRSNSQGDVHAVGFDVDDALTANRHFQFYGTQLWGILNGTLTYYDYAGSEPYWKHYRIPVGQHYTGGQLYLTFANDCDAPCANAESYYSNVRVYEADQEALDFNDRTIEGYGGGNQAGHPSVTVEDGGATLHVVGNGWRKISFPYTVTASTVIELDFKSGAQGDVHGVGFDVDDALSGNRHFKLYGTQGWGIQNYSDYSSAAPGWKHYVIPVGQHFTGNQLYLTFANDCDAPCTGAESYYSNIRVYQ